MFRISPGLQAPVRIRCQPIAVDRSLGCGAGMDLPIVLAAAVRSPYHLASSEGPVRRRVDGGVNRWKQLR